MTTEHAIVLAQEAADSVDVRWCFQQYDDELDRRFETGFELGAALPLDAHELA